MTSQIYLCIHHLRDSSHKTGTVSGHLSNTKPIKHLFFNCTINHFNRELTAVERISSFCCSPLRRLIIHICLQNSGCFLLIFPYAYLFTTQIVSPDTTKGSEVHWKLEPCRSIFRWIKPKSDCFWLSVHFFFTVYLDISTNFHSFLADILQKIRWKRCLIKSLKRFMWLCHQYLVKSR